MAHSALVQICSDGSTVVSRGIVGASAVHRCADGSTSSVSCSYSGNFTGSDQGEHVGLRCSLHLAEGLACHGPRVFMFNMDSWNAVTRYSGDEHVELLPDMVYLDPLIQLNWRELRGLEARGHTCVVRHIDREYNSEADRRAGEMVREALCGSFYPLLHPATEEEDVEAREAVSKSSTMLRARGPFSKSRLARQRRTRSAENEPALPTPPAFLSRYNPQRIGVSVCAHVCETCLVHRCGFRLGHPLDSTAASPLIHECPDCHQNV